jgi:septation ring formation regulator
LKYIIGGIAVLFCIFLTGFFRKKKYYKETDRLEEWKLEITNRPVLDEMQKVKQLNMNGETEEHFERWRSIWDEIVAVQLPDLEELLFDTEEHIDKYRFKKAKADQMKIDHILTNIEEQIKGLLSELQELVGSEEKNRIEIEELKETYRESKKMLLAHRHSFGKLEKHLDQRLEDVSKSFVQFDEDTTNGNYLAAREIVLTIKEVLEKTKKDMEMIPNILIECQATLPSQLYELKEGYKEMYAGGYILDHIQVEEETERISQEIAECLNEIEQSETEEMQEKIDQWKENIDYMYDLLEKEVLAKHEIKQRDREILTMLQSAKALNNELNDELIHIQSSYHLQDSDIEIVEKLAKKLDQLFYRFELIEVKVNENQAAYSQLSEEMGDVKETLEIIATEQTAFGEKLQDLRKDELAAWDQIIELKKSVSETIRLISKSNIPGVPQEYKYLIEDAQESIQQVMEKFEETPLDIPVLKEFLEVAVLTVETVTKKTVELFEMVRLAEKLIQYGNRYRSKYASVDKGLKAAEESFRSFEYKDAYEQAAATIEKVEPGALRKIKDLLEV